MGRRGPAPAPAKIKLLRGETRPSRVNFREPLPPAGMPKMPADMDPVAKVVWRRVARNSPAGVIRAIDADGLRVYCESVSRYVQAAKLYTSSGPLVRGFGGALVKNPLHQMIRENGEQIRLFAREFGLSPSARTGLRVEPEHAIDSVEHDIGLPPRLRAVGDGD